MASEPTAVVAYQLKPGHMPNNNLWGLRMPSNLFPPASAEDWQGVRAIKGEPIDEHDKTVIESASWFLEPDDAQGGPYDWMGDVSLGGVVSERAFLILQKFEPRIQDSIPLSPKNMLTGGELGKWYLLHLPIFIDAAIDIDNTKFGLHLSSGLEAAQRAGFNGRPTLIRASKIAGHHFWRTTKAYGWNTYFSPELHQAWKDAGLTGLRFEKCLASPER